MYESKLQSKDLDGLFEVILKLNTIEECYMFLEDLCTISELEAIGQRYKVAQMLKEKITCQKIAEITGASTATISRVNKCLNHGTGGYNKLLDRLKKGE